MPWEEIRKLSKYTKIMTSLGIVIVMCIVFAMGMSVGYRKASFVEGWEINYSKNFGPFRGILAPFFHDSDNLNPHGAIGSVSSVKLPTLIVHGPNQAEQIVIIGTSTVVRKMRLPGLPSDIALGDEVVVIGSPDKNGRLEATFIRIVTPPPERIGPTRTPNGIFRTPPPAR